MHEPPLISVLMPAYNAERFIAQAIESILAQSHRHFELIIADDGSTDATRLVLERYKDARIRCVCSAENRGYVATYNHLLTLATGDYITFLDADDYCAPERLACQLAAFQANSRLGMVGTAYALVTLKGEVIQCFAEPSRHEEIARVALTRNPFCGASMMISRAAYAHVGGYRPFFGNGYAFMDYDLACRLLESFECANLPAPLYSYRQNPTSLSKRVSARLYMSGELVRHLAWQRRTRGQDDLERGDEAAVTAHMEKLLQPFREDPALVYRIYARDLMFQRLHRQALAAALMAIRTAPRAWVNHRLLASCLKMAFSQRSGWFRR